jgi:hypothetical protein
MRLYADDICTSEVDVEVIVLFGQTPGPAGSAVVQRQRKESDTAIVVKDMIAAG